MKRSFRLIPARVTFFSLMLLCTAGLWGASPTHFDGETVFRGVLLGDGPVAALFPEYYHPPEPQHPHHTLIDVPLVLEAFRDHDPTFCERFGQSLQSGDPVKISQSLDEAEQYFILIAGPHGAHHHGETGSHGQSGHGKGDLPLLAIVPDMASIDRDTLVVRIATRLGTTK